ncbi:putative LRR receptor-like serine/threonine-protein kinase [Heracleum sosnowskyi]|uniref:non-specific serine/threonine protein kinase n=1 Tax=Heracleum sosnowskyi TaxID=360622 RepID=A0AAD8JF63_9APIA|nr:putative LRR receptor-like serine/threonine-protein kinase [Heracleum sosnowskyi]
MDDLRRLCIGLFIILLLFKPTLQQTQIVKLSSRIERVALLQLRSSLGLRSKDWPIKADPCSVWVGIQCQNGKVTGINISGFKRTRIGSQNPQFNVDSLALFSGLLEFNASRFLLPGSIPEWFGQRLRNLQVLDLRGCSVVGAIPPSLGNMTSLSDLYLSGNDLTGMVPDSLGQLSSLSILDLSRNGLTGVIPSSFGSLGNLTLLDMSVNYLYGTIPPAIGALSKLEILNLSSNSLSSSIPSQLSDLSSLVDLDLSLNSFSGSVAPDFRALSNLQKMVIGRNQLSGSLPNNMFAPLIQLQFIVLSHNNFTGEIPGILWSMPSLSFLDASANNFTGILPNLSFVPGANSAVFNLSRNMLYGGLTTVVRRFSFIDLSNNYFQGKVPDYARSNASLAKNCLRDQSSQRATSPCASFYAERGLSFDNFGLPNATQPPPKPHKNSHKKLIILAAVLGSVGLIAVIIIVLVLLIVCTRKGAANSQRGNVVEPVPTSASPPPGVSLNFSSLGEGFTYQQILQATSNFTDADLIKHGHSGDLFRGILEGGISVVIKKIDLNFVKKEAHMQELDFFSKVSHPRLVPLLGHCLDNDNDKYLIYKYMPNGDLSSSLYRKTQSEDDSLQSLDWITRLKIATGAAEALSYLHHECTPPVVHRDVQASSILLDDKFEVRLGSLSEICAQEGESSQSRITRLLRLPQSSEQGATGGTPAATCAYDVYCFGKVLLELVTGKLGLSASTDATMKEWLESTLPYISIYDKELVTNIIDPSLIIDEDLLEEVWAMAIVSRSCLNPKPARRPLMRYILKALENPLKVVREESTGSARLRTTSSRASWNANVFGSWRTSSDVAAVPAAATSNKMEGANSFKRSGTSGSQGSGQNHGGDHSSSYRRQQSRDIFPEPLDEENLERQHED